MEDGFAVEGLLGEIGERIGGAFYGEVLPIRTQDTAEVIELASFHIDEIGAGKSASDGFAEASVGGPEFWRREIFSQRKAVIIIGRDDRLRRCDGKRRPIWAEACCFRGNSGAGDGGLADGRGDAELGAVRDGAGGSDEQDAAEVGFVVNFAEQWFDATGADAGPDESDLAGFEQCVATICVNGLRSAEDAGDGRFKFAGIFAAAKDCICFDGAEGELGVGAAAR